jgi:hypothetical protein
MRIQSPTARALALALAVAPGCGPTSDDINRQPVSGAVTLDKKPLTQGSITFTPLADGPSAGGMIDQGRYSIARADGPAPGSYRVTIVAMQPTGRKLPDPEGPPGSLAEELQNIVPPRYNTKSELKVEVKEGGNTFDFDLERAPAKRP